MSSNRFGKLLFALLMVLAVPSTVLAGGIPTLTSVVGVWGCWRLSVSQMT